MAEVKNAEQTLVISDEFNRYSVVIVDDVTDVAACVATLCRNGKLKECKHLAAR